MLIYLVSPTALHGANTFVMTKGNSMEPGIHQGDLVVARRASSYGVGDAVAYRDPKLGIVLHRIVETDSSDPESDRFVMKGDNNSWLDPYRPRPDEVLGKMRVHIPRAGQPLMAARSPRTFAVLSGVLGVMAVGTFGVFESNKRRNRRAGTPGDGGANGGPGPRRPGRSRPAAGHAALSRRDMLLLAAGVTLALAAALAFLAFRRPTTRTVTKNTAYEQSGAFSYSAHASAGVYDGETATTGDPVFFRLSDRISVRFDYRFAAQAPHAVSGSARMLGRITGDNGWRHTVELAPAVPFSGDSATVTAEINIPEILYSIAVTEQSTGVTGRTYHLTVVPEIAIEGTLAGGDLKETWSPALPLALDPLQITLERSAAGAAAAGPGGTASDPLKPVSKGLAPRPATAANDLSLLVLSLPVTRARTVALFGLAIGALLAAGGAGAAWQARGADEPDRIRARYAPMLLEVRGGDPRAGARTVQVASIEDLARLAGQDGRMILHKNGSTTHSYFVSDGEVVYEYATTGRASDGGHNGEGGTGDDGNGRGRGPAEGM